MRLREFANMAGEPEVIDNTPTLAPQKPEQPLGVEPPTPKGAKVIIYGDDYTFAKAVVYGLMNGTKKTLEQCLVILQTVEASGSAVVGVYGSMDIAETIAKRIKIAADQVPGPEGMPQPPWPLRVEAHEN